MCAQYCFYPQTLFKFPDETNYLFCKNVGWQLLPGVETEWGNPAYGFPDGFEVPAECTLSTECKGTFAGLNETFTCCSNIDTALFGAQALGNNRLWSRTRAWTIWSSLISAASLVFVGWALLAYHAKASPISWATAKCYQSQHDRQNNIEHMLTNAGLTLADLRQLPKELLWPALQDAGIAAVSDKVKTIMMLGKGGCDAFGNGESNF